MVHRRFVGRVDFVRIVTASVELFELTVGQVLDHLFEHPKSEVDEAIEKLGLKQVSDDSAILALIDDVLAANGDKVEEYRGGKEKLFGFFVGQVMKASRGSANPAKVNQLLKERLKS